MEYTADVLRAPWWLPLGSTSAAAHSPFQLFATTWESHGCRS